MKRFAIIFFILTSLVSFGDIIKSNAAAFSIMNNIQNLITPTTKDYVKNGLIAMWDGIENAGVDIHDNNSLIWKDLVGNYDLTIESGSWSTNSYVVGGTRCAYNATSFPSNICTIEIVLLSNTQNNKERIVFATTPIQSNPRGLR